MEEIWAPIFECPNYSISNFGSVINELTGRRMAQFSNQNEYTYVSIFNRAKVQTNKSVALLVATAFLEPDPREPFDTPINLNGYRRDNFVGNLMWRPRWFAMKYHRQFYSGPRGFLRPVYDVHTGEVFDTSLDAAMRYGLLDREILLAALRDEVVWPTRVKLRPVT